MADLMEVSTKAEYAPYLKTLTDVATEVVEGRVMGRKLEFHEGNWELSDKVDNGTIDMASNGYGWSMNFQRALDVLSERQFESVNCSYRENLQNARDAKPNSGIFVQTMQRNEGEGEDEKSFYSYAVIEDGKGMSVSDLGEYLFNIFSSSKSGESDFASEHGIGFISNLAYFETVVVDTKTEGHEPMTIVIKGKYDGDKIRPNRYDIDVLPGHRSINGSTVLCLEKAGYEFAVKDSIDDLCQLLDVDVFTRSSSSAHFDKVNKPYDISKLTNIQEIQSPEIRCGVLGIAESEYSNVRLLQQGFKIDSSSIVSHLKGYIDAVNITPLIGRTGFVEDENYDAFLRNFLSKVLNLAQSVSEKKILNEQEGVFLSNFIYNYYQNGIFCKVPKSGLELPESIYNAQIIETPFNKAVRNLEKRLGELSDDEKVTYKDLMENAEGGVECVSINDVKRAIENGKTIFYTDHISQIAEDVRDEGHIVIDDNFRVKNYLTSVIEGCSKHMKELSSENGDDTKQVEYELSPVEEAFRRTLSRLSGIDIKLARFESPEGEPRKRAIAACVGLKTNYVNMNVDLNQELLELFSMDPESPFVQMAVQSIYMPVNSHEETHSFGFSGHSNDFFITNQNLETGYQHELIKRFKKLFKKHGVDATNYTPNIVRQGASIVRGVMDLVQSQKQPLEEVVEQTPIEQPIDEAGVLRTQLALKDYDLLEAERKIAELEHLLTQYENAVKAE